MASNHDFILLRPPSNLSYKTGSIEKGNSLNTRYAKINRVYTSLVQVSIKSMIFLVSMVHEVIRQGALANKKTLSDEQKG